MCHKRCFVLLRRQKYGWRTGLGFMLFMLESPSLGFLETQISAVTVILVQKTLKSGLCHLKRQKLVPCQRRSEKPLNFLSITTIRAA